MPFPSTPFSSTTDQRPEVAPAPVIAAVAVESQCAALHVAGDADVAVDVVAVAADTDDRTLDKITNGLTTRWCKISLFPRVPIIVITVKKFVSKFLKFRSCAGSWTI